MNAMKKQPTVIVGGGFGGVYTAKHLLKKDLPVLLISETNYFTFTPLLHEVATGNLTRSDIIFEYESFFKNKQFEFLRGTVTNIDTEKKEVCIGKDRVPYTHLVLATGATTNYYRLKGEEHVLPLKTIDEAVAIKKRLVELAQGSSKNVCVNVIGGGPTGVELILEIEQFLRAIAKRTANLAYEIRLIQGGNTILPFFGMPIQEYAKRVLKQQGIKIAYGGYATEATKSSIKTTNGTYTSNLTIMAAGVTPRTKCAHKNFLNEKKHVCVNEYLQIKGTKQSFALGDSIMQNGEPIPKLAQTAVAQAEIVAENIARQKQKHKLTPYHSNVKGTAISLGYGKGAAEVFGVNIKGFPAWWLWRTIYLFKTPGLRNKLRVAFSWTLDLFNGKNLSEG